MSIEIKTTDEHWMREALVRARRAADVSEVPVGAVLILNDEIIGEGWNQSITTHNPIAHAEMIALQQGAQSLQNYRILDSTLYVTLEPCSMCVGAMIHARIKRVVFGAYDKKTGAIESQSSLLTEDYHNHKVEKKGGILQEECSGILTNFFGHLRSIRKGSLS